MPLIQADRIGELARPAYRRVDREQEAKGARAAHQTVAAARRFAHGAVVYKIRVAAGDVGHDVPAIALDKAGLVAHAVGAEITEPQGRRLEAREALPPAVVVLRVLETHLEAEGVDGGEARDVGEAVVRSEERAPEEA